MGDHDDSSFSNFVMHKVDSSYSVNIGEQKYDSMEVSQNPIIDGSSEVRALNVKSRSVSRDADIDEDTSNSWEGQNDNSESDQDPSDDAFKAQMQSAIDSILSLNNDSSPHPSASFHMDQSSRFQSQQ